MILNSADAVYVGNKKINKVYLGNKVVYEVGGGDLPSGYTRVAYLSQINGYFDTGVIPSLDLIMECRIYAVASGYFSGNRKSSTTASRYYPLGFSATNGFYNCKSSEGLGSKEFGIVGDTMYNKYFDIKSTMLSDKVILEVDGNVLEQANSRTDIPTNSLLLFGQRNTNASTLVSTRAPAGTRCGVAKFTQGGELIREMIPCLDSNGTPCYYDKVTGNTYYTPTGRFGYGMTEDSEPIEPVALASAIE